MTLDKKLIFLLLLLSGGLAYGQTTAHKAVFIIVDGIPADVIEKVKTPNLDEITREGGYTQRTWGVAKTLTPKLPPFPP